MYQLGLATEETRDTLALLLAAPFLTHREVAVSGSRFVDCCVLTSTCSCLMSCQEEKGQAEILYVVDCQVSYFSNLSNRTFPFPFYFYVSLIF